MKRRDFLKLLPAAAVPFAAGGCGMLRIDPYHYMIRSPYIDSPEKEAEILSRAKLSWTDDKRVRVIVVRGTPYEMGYQQGALLRQEIQDNMGFLYDQAIRKFQTAELFDEIYERMRPYIPEDYVEEMHGIAHGARIPLHMVHHIHILPELGEWSGKKKIKKVLDKMMAGELATTCSNFAGGSTATPDGSFYAVRVLDWGMHKLSKLHRYPLITVGIPNEGVPWANIGWVGFLGCISGMNAEGITIGEMGYGDPPNETLFGKPMPFMLRDVMRYSHNLADVRKVIQESKPTCSFVFLMTDGKTGDAEMYVRDPDRFVVFRPGDDVHDKKDHLPPIQDVVYGGHYNDRMTKLLNEQHGKLTPELFMNDIIPKIAMPSNFQNVIYEPKKLTFWVSNAKSSQEWAASQPYSKFDFGALLKTV